MGQEENMELREKLEKLEFNISEQQVIFVNYKTITFLQKRFYSREKIRGIKVSSLAEIPPLFHDWLI